MKYIVTWVLTTYFQIPCPYTPPVPDEYGRISRSYITTSVACMSSKTDTLSREFSKRDSAVIFITNGQRQTFSFLAESNISDFKLDSVKIKK